MPRARAVEWRTVQLAVVIYGSWLAVVALHAYLPWWFTAGSLALIVAWHGSLQHEVLHGHPFSNQRANDLVASIPLALRLPYRVYRRNHLAHHDTAELTDPTHDVESFYVSGQQWEAMGGFRRRCVLCHHTLLGRMILGPPIEVVGVLVSQGREIRGGDRELARWWAAHVVNVALLLIFVVGVMGMPVWLYLLGAGYLSHSISLVRSYCEHRWAEGDASRSAVVRAGPFFSLLFLNNNLHHTHHARPGVPWYELPALSRQIDSEAAATEGAGLYSGYREVFGRFLLRPYDHPAHA